MANVAATPQQQQAALRNANNAARSLILSKGIKMVQSIFSQTVSAPQSPNNVINIVPRNVGLITGFYVECTGTITNTSTSSLVLTTLNVSNFLSQIMFSDLNNNVRVNTTGWHMNFVDTAKGQRVFGSAYTQDSPIGYGSNYSTASISGPTSIATSASTTVKMVYYIPMAYSDWDLRGSIYANIINATMNLQLTVNPTPVIASASDNTLAIYKGTGGAGTFMAISVNVYQEYIDQLPVGRNGPVLPTLDLSTIYEIKNTNLTGLSTTQDFPIPYSNFRDFLATYIIYNNGGSLIAGTDINYFALQSANFTNIFKMDPFLASLKSRQIVGDDFPTGCYYFDHRAKPISTIQYGNMELILNPSVVNSNAVVYAAFEDFSLINSITTAGSFPGG